MSWVQLFVEFETSVYQIFVEPCGAFYDCHSAYESGPLFFGEPFLASEPCELTDVLYVCVGIVFARWRPSTDYVLYACCVVLFLIGTQEAESCPQAPFYRVELNELLVGHGGIAVLAPPAGTCNPPNVQRVAVKDSSSHVVKFRV